MHPIINNLSVPSSYQDSFNEGFLQLNEKTEWNNFMEIIKNNIKFPKEKVEWKIKQVELIINPDLDESFESKIEELKYMGCKYDELEAKCVFTKEDKLDIDEIRQNGVLNSKQTNSNNHFADSSMGAHVFTHLDRLLDWCSYKKFKGPIYILMFKTVFGRKFFIDLPNNVDENNNDKNECFVKPIHNYDSFFIDEKVKFDCKFEQYYPSMAYIYDIKRNGQLNNKIRQLMPYAVLTCELLTNDYYLYDFIQQQIINDNKYFKNRNSLKEQFYYILSKEQVQQKNEDEIENNNIVEKQNETSNNTSTNKTYKFIITIGDVKLTRIYSPTIEKRKRKTLFEHIPSMNSIIFNDYSTNLIGLKVSQHKSTCNQIPNNNNKSSFKPSKISNINSIPSIEIVKPLVDLVTQSKTKNNECDLLVVPKHETILHEVLEKFTTKINSYKINSIFANELSNELHYHDTAFKLLEEQHTNKLNNYFRKFSYNQNIASTSIDSEKPLIEKLSLINNKHNQNNKSNNSNSSINITKMPINNQQQQSVVQPSQLQQQQQQEQQQTMSTIPKIFSVDSINDNLDPELLFDYGNVDGNNLLNLDKDLFNSIYDDIKQKGVFDNIDDICDLDNNLNTFQQQNTQENINLNQNIDINNISAIIQPFKTNEQSLQTYCLKALDLNESIIKSNSNLKINGITNDTDLQSLDDLDLEKLQKDPRVPNLIEKFKKKLKSILKFIFKIVESKVIQNDEINKFCDRCENKLKNDYKKIPISQLIDFIKLFDLNNRYLDQENYSKIKIYFGCNVKVLNEEQISNLFSYDCYFNEIKIYIYQLLDYYFTDNLQSNRFISSLLQVKQLDILLDNNQYLINDPRNFKNILNEFNILNTLLYAKTYEIIKNNYYYLSVDKLKTTNEIINDDNVDTSGSEVFSQHLAISNQIDMDIDIDENIDLNCGTIKIGDIGYSDILNDNTISEVEKLLTIVDKHNNNNENNELTEDKNKNNKLNMKPFKTKKPLPSQCSLISEIHAVFEREKQLKLSRARSKSLAEGFKNKKAKENKTKRSNSETLSNDDNDDNDEHANKNSKFKDEIEKTFKEKKLINCFDKITENEDTNMIDEKNDSDSDSEEKYVSVSSVNQTTTTTSTTKTSNQNIDTKHDNKTVNSRNRNYDNDFLNNNEISYDHFRYRSFDSKSLNSKSRARNKTRSRSSSRTKAIKTSRKNYTKEISKSPSPSNKRQRKYSRERSRTRSRSRNRRYLRSRTRSMSRSRRRRHENIRDTNISKNNSRNNNNHNRRSTSKDRNKTSQRSSISDRERKRISPVRRSQSRKRNDYKRARSRSRENSRDNEIIKKACKNSPLIEYNNSRSNTPLSVKSSSSSISSTKSTNLLRQLLSNSNNNERKIELYNNDNVNKKSNSPKNEKIDDIVKTLQFSNNYSFNYLNQNSTLNDVVKTVQLNTDIDNYDYLVQQQQQLQQTFYISDPNSNVLQQSIYDAFQQQYFQYSSIPHLPQYLLYLNPTSLNNDNYQYQQHQTNQRQVYTFPNRKQFRFSKNLKPIKDTPTDPPNDK